MISLSCPPLSSDDIFQTLRLSRFTVTLLFPCFFSLYLPPLPLSLLLPLRAPSSPLHHRLHPAAPTISSHSFPFPPLIPLSFPRCTRASTVTSATTIHPTRDSSERGTPALHTHRYRGAKRVLVNPGWVFNKKLKSPGLHRTLHHHRSIPPPLIHPLPLSLSLSSLSLHRLRGINNEFILLVTRGKGGIAVIPYRNNAIEGPW